MAEAQSQTVKPLEGVTTVDDKMTFEPERLSYRAAERVAAAIGEEIQESRIAGKVVVIAGDALLADFGNLASAKLQLDMLARDYESVAALGEPPPPAGGPAPSAIGLTVAGITSLTAGLQNALGLVALLRENVEFRGVPTKIDARAFELALAVQLKSRGASKVYLPEFLTPTSHQQAPASLTGKWSAVQDVRKKAWQKAGPLIGQIDQQDEALDTAKRAGKPAEVERLTREAARLRRAIEPLSETLSQADRRLADLQAQWTKVSEATGVTLLARLLRTEAITAMNPVYVHAAVVASGGHHRISRSLFRMLLFGDGLSSMGGVVARWAVMDADGSILQGGLRQNRQAARFPMALVEGDGGM